MNFFKSKSCLDESDIDESIKKGLQGEEENQTVTVEITMLDALEAKEHYTNLTTLKILNKGWKSYDVSQGCFKVEALNKNEYLFTSGLSACTAIALVDKDNNVFGLAHYDMKDPDLDDMVKKMKDKGADPKKITVSLSGTTKNHTSSAAYNSLKKYFKSTQFFIYHDDIDSGELVLDYQGNVGSLHTNNVVSTKRYIDKKQIEAYQKERAEEKVIRGKGLCLNCKRPVHHKNWICDTCGQSNFEKVKICNAKISGSESDCNGENELDATKCVYCGADL